MSLAAFIWFIISFLFFVGLPMIFVLRALWRPHRSSASRIAWVLTILGAPILGIVAYILFGETNVGNERRRRENLVLQRLPKVSDTPGFDPPELQPSLPRRLQGLFSLASSVNGFKPLGGNQARLMADSNATIDQMVADIDVAKDHVHLCFYIWLTDNNGMKMIEALKRAAQRGISCRAMADSIGSRALIESPHWKAMQQAGVKVSVALRIGNPFLRILNGRIDLRNHRKNIVIDNFITYSGSQNCADPEFRVKAKYAPWVDIMIRYEGPIARQNQKLFACDWMLAVDEDLSHYLAAPWNGAVVAGITNVAVGTGPTVRAAAMSETFTTLMYTARREIFITTPYFVPDEPIISALCGCVARGIDTTIIFPQKNDSKIVGAASRSYYEELLNAGVKIHEYKGGLLHAKTLTLDGEAGLVGSANMDQRSFDLNYENNVLFFSTDLTQAVRERQEQFLRSSVPVDINEVRSWSVWKKIWNNAVAMVGPVL